MIIPEYNGMSFQQMRVLNPEAAQTYKNDAITAVQSRLDKESR